MTNPENEPGNTCFQSVGFGFREQNPSRCRRKSVRVHGSAVRCILRNFKSRSQSWRHSCFFDNEITLLNFFHRVRAEKPVPRAVLVKKGAHFKNTSMGILICGVFSHKLLYLFPIIAERSRNHRKVDAAVSKQWKYASSQFKKFCNPNIKVQSSRNVAQAGGDSLSTTLSDSQKRKMAFYITLNHGCHTSTQISQCSQQATQKALRKLSV